MKRQLLLLTCFFAFISNAQLTAETIDINGNSRSYYRYLPTGYTSAEVLPVVVVLHGIGDVASNMANVGFNQLADTERFIPVYLQGLMNVYSQTSWNNGTLLGSSGEDVLFISEVIDELEDSLDVDLSKVYVTGFSMGSIMTYTVASVLSDRIAAIACFSGTMSDQQIAASGQLFPVPTLHTHGTADATIPYAGTALPGLSLVEGTMDKNKALNTWAGDSTIYNLSDNASDGITIEKIVYNCGTPLELWKMTGADHIWPYQPVNDTSAILVAWNWFAQHTHPNPSTAEIANPSNDISLSAYPNPVREQLTIKIDLEIAAYTSIQLLDVLGNEVSSIYQGELNADLQLINYSTAELPQGIYFLQVSTNDATRTLKVLKQ